MDITVMENLPTEMLLYIFEMLSYRDLKIAMLVCRRWREIGEIQQLWGSLPVIVNKRNISVMPEILSTTRLLGLHKLRIETDLSEKVSQTIARHPGLREFELSERNDEQTIISVLLLYVCLIVFCLIVGKFSNSDCQYIQTNKPTIHAFIVLNCACLLPIVLVMVSCSFSLIYQFYQFYQFLINFINVARLEEKNIPTKDCQNLRRDVREAYYRHDG